MVNGTKMVLMTPMMKFIIYVVNILQKRKRIGILELKELLKVNVSTCFNFGFPNVSSLIQAFPDIFLVTSAAHMHERSELELNKNSVCKYLKNYNILYRKPNLKFPSVFSTGLKRVQEMKSPEKIPKFNPTIQPGQPCMKPLLPQPTNPMNRVSCSLNKYFNTVANQKPSYDLNNNQMGASNFYPPTYSTKQKQFLNRSLAEEYLQSHMECDPFNYSNQMRRNTMHNVGSSYYQENQYQQLNCTYPQYRSGQDYNQYSQKLYERRNVNLPLNLNSSFNYQNFSQQQQPTQNQNQQFMQPQRQNEGFNFSMPSNTQKSSANASSNSYDFNSLEFLSSLYKVKVYYSFSFYFMYNFLKYSTAL